MAGPENADRLLQAALEHHQAGRLDDAENAYGAVVARDPGNFVAHVNRGVVLHELGRLDDAARCYGTALELDSAMAEVHYAMGLVRQDQGRDADAIAAFRRAIDINPGYAEAVNGLAVSLQKQGQWQDAVDAFGRALAIDPGFAPAHNNLGNLHHKAGRLDDAEASCRRAIALKADYAEAHRNLSHVLLLAGRFEDGWEEFRWRWRCADFPSPRRSFPQPLWQGDDVAGKTILVWGEQGVGDEVQFAGMVPDLLDAGGRVVIESDPRLVPLFERSFKGVTCVPRETPPRPETEDAAIDFQTPMGDLGRWLRPDMDSFPGRESYLVADGERAQALRAQYLGGGDLLVGIAWVSKNPEVGRDKSMTLDQWAPLAGIPGLRFIDLQYGDTAAERRAFEDETGAAIIHDETVDQMADLDAFAAQVRAMDLVVSVSNTTVHIAGAMNVPTWVLLHHLPLSVWMMERDDSPWYPSLELFRQQDAGQWGGVMARVHARLAAFAESGGDLDKGPGGG